MIINNINTHRRRQACLAPGSTALYTVHKYTQQHSDSAASCYCYYYYNHEGNFFSMKSIKK